MVRGGNRAGQAWLGRANSGRGWAGPIVGRAKIGPIFLAKILTDQPALKTEPVGPNSLFKEKKNFRRTGLTHLAGPILPPLLVVQRLSVQISRICRVRFYSFTC